MPDLDRRMLVDAGNLETPHDRRSWMEEHKQTIGSRSGEAENGVQARAVDADYVGEIELQLIARRQRAQRLIELRHRREVQVSH